MKFNIVKKRNLWFSISGILCLLSIILIAIGGLKPGVDLTGGSFLTLSYAKEIKEEEEISLNAMQSVFTETIGDKGEIIIKSEKGFKLRSKKLTREEKDGFLSTLNTDKETFKEDKFYSISGNVSASVKQKAFIALGLSIIAIILFIALAFHKVPKKISPWKFGLAAIVALIHDVLITTGVFALLGLLFNVEIGVTFLVALLTVMGFSVNDTIVVFDRVRERLKDKKVKTFDKIAESALWQTMARSINTSFSTFVLLASLMVGLAMVLGIHDDLIYFILALIIGIIVGTYSSIFLATPLLVAWKDSK